MAHLFSFKTIRYLSFSLLILLNLFGGFFFFLLLQNVAETMSDPIQEERPFLNKIIELQNTTSELDLSLHKQLSGEIIENRVSVQLIDKILTEIENLTQEKIIHEDDLHYLNKFAKEVKRLKLALGYYRENRLYDSASSSTEELFEIIDESIIEINSNLNSIIAIIRRQISESDEKVLEGTRFIQKTIIVFITLIVAGTMVIIYFFNSILSANLKVLIDGTKQLGAGNLDWRIKSKFDDEFGKLSNAFNDMAGKIADSKQSILSQTDEIKRLAYFDSLTLLPNRNAFLDKLEQEVARAKRNYEKIAVLFVDLDDFKLVNDAFGHEVGDLLLKQVAKRLQRNSRLSDTVVRLAGDEFAIILTHLSAYQDSSNVGQRIIDDISCPVIFSNKIIEDLARPFTVENNKVTVSCSIGIAVYPENGMTASDLLNSADTAMYAAKKEGKNKIKYCTDEMTQKMRNLVNFERNIRQALDNSEFGLYFQPQVDLATKEIIGLEALIRWHHPQRGIIPPIDFIPIAEERGIIQDISKWVINDVFYHLKLWREAGCRLVPVMVNLSGRDFFQQGIENYLFDVLLDEQKELRKLFGVEVTETAIMADRDNAVSTLSKLKILGVKIALDDFGTGFSSLNYLQYLPIDVVKVDRSFIKNITKNPSNAAITKAIISLSHALNLKVLAEGIETSEQEEFLCDLQCDLAQGYLFHKPLPSAEISKLLGAPSRQEKSESMPAFPLSAKM